MINTSVLPPLALLDELQQLTQKMLEQIKQGDVDALSVLEQQRQSVITEYQTHTIDKIPPELIAEKLLNITELDKSLNVFCKALHEQLSTQLKSIHNGRRAKKAYHKNTA